MSARPISSISFIALLITVFFMNPAITMDTSHTAPHVDVSTAIRHDPPFYKIFMPSGAFIYILGSIHPLPVELALTHDAYEELGKIATKETPMYFTEHSTDNVENLKHFHEAATGKPWLTDPTIIHNNREKWETIRNEKINISLDLNGHIEVSNNHIYELEDIDPWLAAPTFAIHCGAFLKRKFGSFEHNILVKWGEHLQPINYLESHEYALNAFKNNALKGYHDHIGWINAVLTSYTAMENYDSDELSRNFMKERYIKFIENYNSIHYSSMQKAAASTIERNHEWVKNLMKYFNSSRNLLIVVGAAHLEGPENFLIILLNNIEKHANLNSHEQVKIKVQRYRNGMGWTNFLN